MSETPKFEPVHGYKIKRAVCFDDGWGFALGERPSAAFPLATWFFEEINGKRAFYCGNYYLRGDADAASLDYNDRTEKYKRDNPGVMERYNYLAAAEMSGEDNYNQIDGVPNNTTKPSILEHLRQFHPKQAKQSNTPNRSSEIDR